LATQAWSFELTVDTIPPLRQELAWVLQHRRAKLVILRVSVRRRQQTMLVVLPVFAALLAFGRWGAKPPMPDKYFYAGCGLLAVMLILLPLMPRYFAASARFVGRQVARVAERKFAPIADRAPYTIHYELDGDVLTGGRQTAPLDLGKVTRAMVTRNAIWLFTSALAQAPERPVFTPGPAAGHPLVAMLEARGVEIQHITSHVDRYGEWSVLPRATLR
jgi:hypothetical protein